MTSPENQPNTHHREQETESALAIIDLETLDLDPTLHPIIELGMLLKPTTGCRTLPIIVPRYYTGARVTLPPLFYRLFRPTSKCRPEV